MENKSFNTMPVSKITWRHRDDLRPNDYNPNRVAGPELRLLKISIMEDGWTQPIVINENMEIVDGFHRWTVSDSKELRKLTDGMVPTVMISPHENSDQKMSTIRHNRARGTHGVLNMAEIVKSFVEAGLPKNEIMEKLQMEEEEVIRLAQRVGIPQSDLIADKDFSKSWGV